ncbi:MAG TPA: GNAT family N-acetyltransferase [Chitinophagaceae bacterium]|jgi:L-amino acid N-acyltransferase YncA|nr:GNAT family N-acetyltransferase [Chitinophagaceae bacterium]
MKNLMISLHRLLMRLKRPSKHTNIRLLTKQGETLSTFRIREARAEDIPALATLHVKTWRETYWTVLFPPTYEIRYRQWQQQFSVTDGSWFCYVVENRNGELVGFAKGKAYNHPDLPEFSGELNKIYLLRKYQRIGLGRKLIGDVARRFLLQGISNMVLFGTAENPSCKFHEAMGGERLFAKNGEFHGGYCWRDLQKLADAGPID